MEIAEEGDTFHSHDSGTYSVIYQVVHVLLSFGKPKNHKSQHTHTYTHPRSRIYLEWTIGHVLKLSK